MLGQTTFMRDKFAGSLIHLLEEQADTGLNLATRIQNAIRRLIVSGALKRQDRLPSSRTLATELGVARDTVEAAYQHLESEGFLKRLHGSGTFVADSRSDLLHSPAQNSRSRRAEIALASRGNVILELGGVRDPGARAFAAAMPDMRAFPATVWNRIASRVMREQQEAVLNYSDPQGLGSLRDEIARYLAAHRGVRCSAENIVVLTSSQQALAMISSLLLDPGETVAVEDPGYPGVKAALRMAGAQLLPIGVDSDGLKVDALSRHRVPIRGVYVTPSNQYPTGVTLSLDRRIALIEWARRNRSWIIEDDYDSEYRYAGAPISCIQGLDPAASVLYVGTFTKTLFPGARLAYLVAPAHLVKAFVTARTLVDGHSALLNQAVLAEFMASGHFTAHIRRMRQLYKGRRDAFLEAFARYLSPYASCGVANGGFQITCDVHDDVGEASSIATAAKLGVELPSLRRLYLARPQRSGWVMGYVALTPQDVEGAMCKLARSLGARSSTSR
ncbi:MocR-like pyridoxine biosynthesis transcription factor PdxR [Hyphomicrobium sp.]|uniref:MocR-like pyridoxine biosynthesis transcription factor PdxR n=1 Tax=Hyphomicrobium sp. TaxID=82 RepID=UPI002FE40B89